MMMKAIRVCGFNEGGRTILGMGMLLVLLIKMLLLVLPLVVQLGLGIMIPGIMLTG